MQILKKFCKTDRKKMEITKEFTKYHLDCMILKYIEQNINKN